MMMATHLLPSFHPATTASWAQWQWQQAPKHCAGCEAPAFLPKKVPNVQCSAASSRGVVFLSKTDPMQSPAAAPTVFVFGWQQSSARSTLLHPTAISLFTPTHTAICHKAPLRMMLACLSWPTTLSLATQASSMVWSPPPCSLLCPRWAQLAGSCWVAAGCMQTMSGG